MTKPAKRLLINILVIVALTGVTLLILLLSYDDLNFSTIFKFISEGKTWCFVLALVCMLLFIICEGLSLLFITRRMGHRTKLRQGLAYSCADIYYSAITPSATGGQPASFFYMKRDNMSAGIAGFSLILNLMAYTLAILIMGVFALIARPNLFGVIDSGFAQTLVILGIVLQCMLFAFFLFCLFWSSALLKAGNGLIALLTKIKIIKHPDRWRERWQATIDKYRGCKEELLSRPLLFFIAVILNLIQRVAQTLIPCFICYAVAPNVSLLDLFVMQTYVLLGYNSIPLPGGVGAYEFMYLNTYCAFFEDAFILSAMTVSRVISFYLCMIVSGIYTLVYHSLGIKKKSVPQPKAEKEGDAEESENQPPNPETGETNDE